MLIILSLLWWVLFIFTLLWCVLFLVMLLRWIICLLSLASLSSFSEFIANNLFVWNRFQFYCICLLSYCYSFWFYLRAEALTNWCRHCCLGRCRCCCQCRQNWNGRTNGFSCGLSDHPPERNIARGALMDRGGNETSSCNWHESESPTLGCLTPKSGSCNSSMGLDSSSVIDCSSS